MTEEWRPIPGHEGYEVSDLGRVRSLDREHITKGGIFRKIRGRVLSPGVTHGYHHVTLWRENVQTVRKVHYLVLLAFVGPRPDGLVTRHLNGDPTDNRPENLAYGTHTENELDTIAHGRHFQASKTHCKQGHPYDEANTYPTARQRTCRACRSAWARARYLRKKAAA